MISNQSATARLAAALIICVLMISHTKSSEEEHAINKYCRERDEIHEDEDESQDYLLVDVAVNSTVILQCTYW